jgi:G protein-coupled receptor 107
VKGVMMFVVILLIGMGWSLMKPFLAEHDKKIMLIVIPLQVIDNIALIIVEDTAPGSQGWFAWVTLRYFSSLITLGVAHLMIL